MSQIIVRNTQNLVFVPAKSKLEAVARISALTNSGPEILGPGSKERKSVLVNLANGMTLNHLASGTKQNIARAIARELDLKWTSECESVGQTVTLKGLNLLLEAGMKFFLNDNKLSLLEMELKQEVDAISKVVTKRTPKFMDGKESILQMKNAEYSKWRETEWQGFFFEFKVRSELINSLGGGPIKIGKTEFDYSLSRIWDMKTHSITKSDGNLSNSDCPLNDLNSMDEIIRELGFGLIVLSGIPTYDLEFTRWHKKFRSGKLGEPRRILKKSFESQTIDLFFIPNTSRLNKALNDGQLKIFKQGRQQSGAKRAEKYSLNLNKSRNTDLHIFSGEIT